MMCSTSRLFPASANAGMLRWKPSKNACLGLDHSNSPRSIVSRGRTSPAFRWSIESCQKGRRDRARTARASVDLPPREAPFGRTILTAIDEERVMRPDDLVDRRAAPMLVRLKPRTGTSGRAPG